LPFFPLSELEATLSIGGSRGLGCWSFTPPPLKNQKQKKKTKGEKKGKKNEERERVSE
jgi:hypothetical protein